MQLFVSIAAGLLTSLVGWFIVQMLLRPSVSLSPQICVESAFGRERNAMVRVRNRGVFPATDVALQAWLVLTHESQAHILIELETSRPLLTIIGAVRPEWARIQGPVGVPFRIVTIGPDSSSDPRLMQWAGARLDQSSQQIQHAFSTSLIQRDDYYLVVACSATNAVSGRRSLTATRRYEPTDIVQGRFAAGLRYAIDLSRTQEPADTVSRALDPISRSLGIDRQELARSLDLESLSEDQRLRLLHVFQGQLEERVGRVLSVGMTDEQMHEFEGFIDRDSERVTKWLNEHAPDYLHDSIYSEIVRHAPSSASTLDVAAEYAALMWLQQNRPDYRDSVHAVTTELIEEVRYHFANSDHIPSPGQPPAVDQTTDARR
jgi:hypothetical protein